MWKFDVLIVSYPFFLRHRNFFSPVFYYYNLVNFLISKIVVGFSASSSLVSLSYEKFQKKVILLV